MKDSETMSVDILEVEDGRKGKFWWVDNLITDQYAEHLGLVPTMVYYVLCRLSVQNQVNAGKSQWETKDIARLSGNISTRAVTDALPVLERWQLIEVVRRRGSRNRYRILEAPATPCQLTDAELDALAERQSRRIKPGRDKSTEPSSSLPKSQSEAPRSLLSKSTEPSAPLSKKEGTTFTPYKDSNTRLKEQDYIAADAAPPQKPVKSSKKKTTSRQTPIQTEPVMVPPAPPVSPEQAAADLAMFDDLESASGRELPPPTGTSKDAIERALILACVPSGERREINALMGQIRKAGLIIREGDICTADDIMARCVGKGSLFYTTHFAENDEDGLTKPPTPMTIATWIWKLEECRSRKFKPVRAPIDYDQALAEAEARAARSREQSDPSPFKPIIPAWQVLTMPRRTA